MAMAVPRSTATPDLREHIALLWTRKWLVVACVAVAVVVALAYSLTRTPLYRASTQVVISGGMTSTGAASAPASVTSDVRLAQSGSVRAASRETTGSAAQLSVAGDNATASMTFTAVSSDPDTAAKAADSYAAAFIEARQSLRQQQSDATTSVLKNQIAGIDAQLTSLADDETTRMFAATDEATRTSIEADYASRRSSLEDKRKRYNELLDSVSVSVGLSQTGGVQVSDPATVPSSPFSPDVSRNVALAGVLGLIFGIGLVYLLQYLDTKVRDETDLTESTGLPNLAMVPVYGDAKLVKGRRRPADDTPVSVVTLEHPRSEVSEAYRRLRTSVQFLGIEQPLVVVQITSPTVGDGKTTTAANLAVTAARAGQRVVLVDCDLRRPRQHDFFSIDNDAGVTAVLTGKATLPDVVHRIQELPNLVVLPSGPLPPDPAELLGSKRMGELITALRDSADLIVLDTPPVLAVSDPLIVSALADGVLLVASAGRTDRRQVARSMVQLRQVDAPFIGTVLNRFQPYRGPGYGYGYGYGHGYGGYGYGGPSYTSESRADVVGAADGAADGSGNGSVNGSGNGSVKASGNGSVKASGNGAAISGDTEAAADSETEGSSSRTRLFRR